MTGESSPGNVEPGAQPSSGFWQTAHNSSSPPVLTQDHTATACTFLMRTSIYVKAAKTRRSSLSFLWLSLTPPRTASKSSHEQRQTAKPLALIPLGPSAERPPCDLLTMIQWYTCPGEMHINTALNSLNSNNFIYTYTARSTSAHLHFLTMVGRFFHTAIEAPTMLRNPSTAGLNTSPKGSSFAFEEVMTK